jgi:hypothetical protein
MKRLLPFAVVAAALITPAAHATISASSGFATTTVKAAGVLAPMIQNQGRVDPNGCATQRFALNGPAQITVLLAGTNAGGDLYAQVIGRRGDVGGDNGYYVADAAGTYGVQVCFRSDDGIDNAQISYVDAIVIEPR